MSVVGAGFERVAHCLGDARLERAGARSSGHYHCNTPSYDRFTWERADRFAIDMGGGAWNAGHVNALVAAGGDLLVGIRHGGRVAGDG